MSLWSASALLRLEECTRARSRGLTVMVLGYVAVLCAMAAVGGYAAVQDTIDYDRDTLTGEPLFRLLLVTQFVLLCGIGPTLASASVTAEKERGSMELLATTLLRPAELWLGKMAAAMALVWVLWWAGLPFLTLCMFLGGIEPPAVITGYLFLLLVFVTYCAFGVWVSTRAQRTVTGITTVLGTLIFLNVLLPSAYLMLWRLFADWLDRTPRYELELCVALLSPLLFLRQRIGEIRVLDSLEELGLPADGILLVVAVYGLATAGFARAAMRQLRYPRR